MRLMYRAAKLASLVKRENINVQKRKIFHLAVACIIHFLTPNPSIMNISNGAVLFCTHTHTHSAL